MTTQPIQTISPLSLAKILMRYSYQAVLALVHPPEILFWACSCVLPTLKSAWLWLAVLTMNTDMTGSTGSQFSNFYSQQAIAVVPHFAPLLPPQPSPKPRHTPASFKLQESKQQKYLVKDTTLLDDFSQLKVKMSSPCIWKLHWTGARRGCQGQPSSSSLLSNQFTNFLSSHCSCADFWAGLTGRSYGMNRASPGWAGAVCKNSGTGEAKPSPREGLGAGLKSAQCWSQSADPRLVIPECWSHTADPRVLIPDFRQPLEPKALGIAFSVWWERAGNLLSMA